MLLLSSTLVSEMETKMEKMIKRWYIDLQFLRVGRVKEKVIVIQSVLKTSSLDSKYRHSQNEWDNDEEETKVKVIEDIFQLQLSKQRKGSFMIHYMHRELKNGMMLASSHES